MFYTKNLDKVADQLHYTHKIRNMRLSDRMRYFESENNCYTWAEGLTETTFNDVLYKKLLGLLPRNVRKTLKKLDKEIKKLENDIKSTTGWELYDRNVMYSYHRNFKPTLSEPAVYRNEQGFYVEELSLYSEIYKRIYEVSKEFFDANKSKLEKLHELLSMKEELMNRAIHLVDVSDMKLAREIVLFLGYNPYDGEEKGVTYYNRSFR